MERAGLTAVMTWRAKRGDPSPSGVITTTLACAPHDVSFSAPYSRAALSRSMCAGLIR